MSKMLLVSATALAGQASAFVAPVAQPKSEVLLRGSEGRVVLGAAEQPLPAAETPSGGALALGLGAGIVLAAFASTGRRGKKQVRGRAAVVPRRAMKEDINAMIAKNKVFVVSKAFCPFCKKAKEALESVGAKFEVLEIEDTARQPLVDDASAVQDYMLEMTGARSVPRVFIDGKCIGGGDDVVKMKNSGELEKLLASLGALASSAAPAAAETPFVLDEATVAASAKAAQSAKVKVGDVIPNIGIDTGFPPEKFMLGDFCKGKKVVLVGLPGAFTPT